MGTDYGLWFTTNAGQTWNRETQVPMITIFQMRMRKSDRRLFIFTYGRGIWIGTLPVLNTGTDEGSMTTIKLYPNPVSEKCHALFDTGINITGYSLLDMQGKILNTKLSENDRSGTLEIDMRRYDSGIYFVEFRTPEAVIRKKVVKL
jgi:hypothetical protein